MDQKALGHSSKVSWPRRETSGCTSFSCLLVSVMAALQPQSSHRPHGASVQAPQFDFIYRKQGRSQIGTGGRCLSASNLMDTNQGLFECFLFKERHSNQFEKIIMFKKNPTYVGGRTQWWKNVMCLIELDLINWFCKKHGARIRFILFICSHFSYSLSTKCVSVTSHEL